MAFLAWLLTAGLIEAAVATRFLGQGYEEFLSHLGLLELRKGEAPELAAERRAAFEQHEAAAAAQNRRLGSSWRAGTNNLSDLTAAELQGLLGYKPVGRKKAPAATASPSFLQTRQTVLEVSQAPANRSALPEEMDWRPRLRTVNDHVIHQGSCGSCWAIAAAGALEAHAEISTGAVTRLAYGELLRCVENPQRCGGSGGCDGATSELAFDWVCRHGLSHEEHWSSHGGSEDSCGMPRQQAAAVWSSGFVHLPANRGAELLHAVVHHGPVVVSVDATDWTLYESGVFDGCRRDATTNHAVLLVGYGKSSEGKYWLIRNSWGLSWGEGGFIRLLRHDEDDYCGVDYQPEVGVGCDGGPSEVPVCGMCGILSDSSYPIGVNVRA